MVLSTKRICSFALVESSFESIPPVSRDRNALMILGENVGLVFASTHKQLVTAVIRTGSLSTSADSQNNTFEYTRRTLLKR